MLVSKVNLGRNSYHFLNEIYTLKYNNLALEYFFLNAELGNHNGFL